MNKVNLAAKLQSFDAFFSIEPLGTLNTGDAGGALTAKEDIIYLGQPSRTEPSA